MTKLSSTLSILLLASTALVAPGIAAAQTGGAAPAPGLAATAPVEAQEEPEAAVDELVVRGNLIPDTMRQTSEVATVVLAEDLARQGDDTAAAALNRVAGLNVVSGRFIYVRGLGERYSSALLNGSPLPSPEPLQRVVPLDLFPSNILAGAVVQKTYSPQYPGEFGGGVINLQTTAVPTRSFLTMSAGVGMNLETTGLRGLTYYGSDTDWTGFDDGTRDMPDVLQQAIDLGRGRISDATFTQQDLARIGSSFVNAPLNLIQYNNDIPANFGVDITAGTRVDLGWGDFGVIAVGGYDNAWQTRRGVQEEGFLSLTGDLTANTHYDYMSTQNDIVVNGLLGFGLNWGENEIRWTNLYVRSTTKEARSRVGIDFNSPIPEVRDDFTEWFARDLFSTQLAGDHEFGPLEVQWRAALAKTKRESPYEKSVRYVLQGGRYIYGLNNANSTSFGVIDDEVASAGIDFKYDLEVADRPVSLSAGYALSRNDRSGSQRVFQFQSSGLPAAVQSSRVDYLFSDYNLYAGYFTLRETTGSSGAAAYDGVLDTDAVYAQADVEVFPTLRAAVGLRYETSEQSVLLQDLFGGTPPPSPAPLDNDYVLPAATLTWNFYENMQLRVGASQTITRPQFRELAPQQFLDPETDRLFFGNPYLTDSELVNLDARYEWYFAKNQFLALGAFYKDIDRPVEVVVNEGGSALQTTFINAPRAMLYGAEIEARRYFEMPFGSGWMQDAQWFVAANYTFINSELKVKADDEVFPLAGNGAATPATVYFADGDRLQGQSDHLANLQFGVDHEEQQLQATFLVNYGSERISARGRPGYPDLIVDPGVTLDFTFRKGLNVLGRDVEFGFEARNLLDRDFEETQTATTGTGSVIINSYPIGRSFSFSLKREF